MLDLTKDWSVSFAGCGFMGVYYVGAASCVFERFPALIRGASTVCGASAGALMATVVTLGLPLDQCLNDLMLIAKRARKSRLGPLHPAFNLLQNVQESLLTHLPEDAHVRVSGKLCVSLTRVSDGKNVLVSEFSSREELVQALLCSCFVPLYCGVIPPTYRGVHYVDGAISDNLPRCHQKNTVTISAYAGENDICPRASSLCLHEVRFSNVSIQVNSENMYRVTSTFFPPQPEAIAEICQNGYLDALRFLQEHNLISSEGPLTSLEADESKLACCEWVTGTEEAEEFSNNTQQKDVKAPQRVHSWLNPRLVEHLPVILQKVLCEACREAQGTGGLLSNMTRYLPERVSSYLQASGTPPVDSPRSLARRLVDWIPDVPKDVNWLYGMVEDLYKVWKDEEEYDREKPLRRCASLPLGLDLWNRRPEDAVGLPLTPEATPKSNLTFTWNPRGEALHAPLTPPPTPTRADTSGFDSVEGSRGAGGGWGLGRAVGWIRNVSSERPSNVKKTKVSVSMSAFK